MSTRLYLLALLVCLVIPMNGCRNYSSVSEHRPKHHSVTPAGLLISRNLKHPAARPEEQIGSYQDAAAAAGIVLERAPEDIQARSDYNFAVGRIFEIIHERNLAPWAKPLQCPGAKGPWIFSLVSPKMAPQDPSHFRVLPADRYEFRGSLVKQRTLKHGLGAPMVATTKDIDLTKLDRFAQGKRTYYGVTGLLTFRGRTCTATIHDPLAAEVVEFAGHTFPLSADFTAPLALALAELKPGRQEIRRLLAPEEFATTTRLARLQPYDPKKIPILCIHGLGDSHATWAPLIETLRGDATIRQHYQFWFFSYPTGNPYPLMASVLRQEMDAMNARYPNHKPFVVIGHSMGGMIARELMTDSGMTLWNAYFDKSPMQLQVASETRKLLSDALIFKSRRDVARVIFASASHRGSDIASGFIGRLGSKLIGGNPLALGKASQQAIAEAKPGSSGEYIKSMPTSINALDPKNRFVTTIDKLPLTKRIPFNSIIGDRGKGGNLNSTKPISTDGIVPYWSSHLDGNESELIVPSGHWTNQNPVAIAEIRRILLKHIGR